MPIPIWLFFSFYAAAAVAIATTAAPRKQGFRTWGFAAAIAAVVWGINVWLAVKMLV